RSGWPSSAMTGASSACGSSTSRSRRRASPRRGSWTSRCSARSRGGGPRSAAPRRRRRRDVEPRLRIGELARRTQVSPDVLRAWERRYGLLEPQRTDGGFRLYTAADEDRVQAMVRHLGAGVSAGEAARLVLEAEAPPAGLTPSLEGVADELREALDDFDDA